MVESESGAFCLYYLSFSYRIAFSGTSLWLFFMSLWCPRRIGPTLNAFWFCELHKNQILLNPESRDVEP